MSSNDTIIVKISRGVQQVVKSKLMEKVDGRRECFHSFQMHFCSIQATDSPKRSQIIWWSSIQMRLSGYYFSSRCGRFQSQRYSWYKCELQMRLNCARRVVWLTSWLRSLERKLMVCAPTPDEMPRQPLERSILKTSTTILFRYILLWDIDLTRRCRRLIAPRLIELCFRKSDMPKSWCIASSIRMRLWMDFSWSNRPSRTQKLQVRHRDQVAKAIKLKVRVPLPPPIPLLDQLK